MTRLFIAFLLCLPLTGCGGEEFREVGPVSFCIYDDGATYFSFEACEAGKPTRNYIQPTNFGIAGGGFTVAVDTCQTQPEFVLGPYLNEYEIDNTDSLFTVNPAWLQDVEPDPRCHVALIDRRGSRPLRLPGWRDVRVVQ